MKMEHPWPLQLCTIVCIIYGAHRGRGDQGSILLHRKNEFCNSLRPSEGDSAVINTKYCDSVLSRTALSLQNVSKNHFGFQIRRPNDIEFFKQHGLYCRHDCDTAPLKVSPNCVIYQLLSGNIRVYILFFYKISPPYWKASHLFFFSSGWQVGLGEGDRLLFTAWVGICLDPNGFLCPKGEEGPKYIGQFYFYLLL